MDAQLDNFANSRQYIISSLGVPAATEQLNEALYSVTIGSNDFINNYLTPVVSAAKQKLVSPQSFVSTLISKFRLQLTVKFTSSLHINFKSKTHFFKNKIKNLKFPLIKVFVFVFFLISTEIVQFGC